LELIKEEIFSIGNKVYTIKVEFDGENYIASGYLDGNLVNQTQQSNIENKIKHDANSPEIENLLYLIKEDFKENEL
jgi:hypothetical protein